MNMQSYLTNMPKAELHLHLEGTLSPETTVKITQRNNLDYFKTVDEIKESLANRPPGLMGFLEHHFKSQNVMQTQQDFHDATYTLIEKLDENNVIYVDLFFDPQAHTSRGIPFGEFFGGIDSAREDAKEKFATEVNLIMCFHRERDVEKAFEMLEQAKPYKDKIIGVGMDSGPEYGNPPIKFKDVYARAREEGYFLTGHCDVDVQDTLEHIWQSVDIIKMDRIDHGLNAIEDPKLIKVLIKRDICLTGSPVKRITDPVLQDFARIAALDDAGVCVSIHTDDPEEFESGYLTNMMILFQEAGGYSKARMTRLMLNAFKALWLPKPEKDAYINQLKKYAEMNDVSWDEVMYH
ncbi:MAG: adenosine deaminase [Anaerolineae bacterium]|jgi:adenosine deaminase|nr:adenosine deaminase [Anaerolineae bacterium]